ncbi:hypothetical protein ACQVP2_34615 [Methylobacterium aquaticum]|uniref:hypothetical protein n=1 Tax=Methylobacterium aquaticum TaxID=270351 RepID=UPI003D178DC1
MTALLAPAHKFGPWADNLTDAERRARLRAMRAITRLICGRRGQAFEEILERAETDPAALVASVDELGRLAPLDRRQVLGSYAGLHRPRTAGGAT